jgi:RimJ/RimL family protein N-acetyltransferase
MLRGDKVMLREWREADLERLATLRNDVALQRMLMAQARPNPVERVRQWLVDRGAREDMVFFVIAGEDDGVLGYIQVAGIDRFHGHGDLGICLSPEAHGLGAAAEACRLLERYLVDTMGMHKLTLKVLVDNTRAIAFYLKHGYREVGVLERHFRDGDSLHDVMIMERLLGP